MPDERPIKKPCSDCACDGNHDCVCAECKNLGWAHFTPYVVMPLDPNIIRKLEAMDNA